VEKVYLGKSYWAELVAE